MKALCALAILLLVSSASAEIIQRGQEEKNGQQIDFQRACRAKPKKITLKGNLDFQVVAEAKKNKPRPASKEAVQLVKEMKAELEKSSEASGVYTQACASKVFAEQLLSPCSYLRTYYAAPSKDSKRNAQLNIDTWLHSEENLKGLKEIYGMQELRSAAALPGNDSQMEIYNICRRNCDKATKLSSGSLLQVVEADSKLHTIVLAANGGEDVIQIRCFEKGSVETTTAGFTKCLSALASAPPKEEDSFACAGEKKEIASRPVGSSTGAGSGGTGNAEDP